MMKRGVADNAVEGLFQDEVVGIFAAIFDVGCGSTGASDGQHRFGKIDGHNGVEMTGKLMREDAGAASDIHGATADLRKMFQEEIGGALHRGSEVVFLRQMI